MSKQIQTPHLILFSLILIIAGALRFAALADAPPGLTHDEADHGVDAAGVLEGIRPLYFTVGYGREPLYDYVTSLTMRVGGDNFMGSRVTSVIFGMGLLLLCYGWVRKATGNQAMALAIMAGLAVGFWPVSVSRHALRTITLPVMFMGSALAMWQGLGLGEDDPPNKIRWRWFILAGVCLGLSFYTYLAARIMWAVFPAFFVYLWITQREIIRRNGSGLLVMTAITLLVAAPIGWYLQTNPSAEVRIGQLTYPIDALMVGDPMPLLTNVRAGLGMITFYGDDLWLYNIPGKPLLDPVLGGLFYLGIVIAVISVIAPYQPSEDGRWFYHSTPHLSSANAFMLLVFSAGMVPALITGVGASNTRVIGMLPALYYFPALAGLGLANWMQLHTGKEGRTTLWSAYGIIFIVVGGLTIHNYFTVWNTDRDVRVAYHTTLVETLDYIDAHPEIGPDIGISSITPGIFHDPAVARMWLKRDDLRIRWFDGRNALVFPATDASEITLFFPEIAQPDGLFAFWIGEDNLVTDTIQLRPDDFNREVSVIQMQGQGIVSDANLNPIYAGDTLGLVEYTSSPSVTIAPGETIDVITLWTIETLPSQELMLFTHVVDAEDNLVGQQDLLGYPPHSWVVGDSFAQIHRITLPLDIAPGLLEIRVGVYTFPDLLRLQLSDHQGQPLGDYQVIDHVEVVTP